jgi:hypothetical protein
LLADRCEEFADASASGTLSGAEMVHL